MPQPTPTPTPAGISLFGQEFPMYGPDVDEHVGKYVGPEFMRLIEEMEAGRSKVGPRPGVESHFADVCDALSAKRQAADRDRQ